MNKLLIVIVVVVLGVLIWQIGGRLSTDAVGMAVGMVFGALSGIPAALLILATARRGEGSAELRRMQPPVVVVNPPAPKYTVAHPFEIQPAQPTVTLAADDDCPDWCEPWIWEEVYGRGTRGNGRQFRIIGEVER